MKKPKAKNQEDLSNLEITDNVHTCLRERWLFLVYGNPLYKSQAVAVLEGYRLLLTSEKYRGSLNSSPRLFEASDEYESKMEAVLKLPATEQDAHRPFPDFKEPFKDWFVTAHLRKSLRAFDANFFSDLSQAIKCIESSDRNLINHFLVVKYLYHILPSLIFRKRGIPNRKELEEKVPHCTMSVIVSDLKLVKMGLVKEEKRGRKPKSKKTV